MLDRFYFPLYIALLLLIFMGSFFLLRVLPDSGEDDPFVAPDGTRYCFTIIDHRGEAHPSEQEPHFIPGTEAYYETLEELGIVMAPLVIRIDVPCMEAAEEVAP